MFYDTRSLRLRRATNFDFFFLPFFSFSVEVYSILMSSDVTDANYQETGIQLELPLPIDVSVYRQLVGDRQSLTLQSAAAADPE